MRITCERCLRRYDVPDRAILGRRLRARCKCGARVMVESLGVEGQGPADQRAAARPARWFVDMTSREPLAMEVQQLRRAFEAGRVHDATLVWRKGMEDWRSLAEVPELTQLLRQLTKPMAAFAPAGALASAGGPQLVAEPQLRQAPYRLSAREPEALTTESLAAVAQPSAELGSANLPSAADADAARETLSGSTSPVAVKGAADDRAESSVRRVSAAPRPSKAPTPPARKEGQERRQVRPALAAVALIALAGGAVGVVQWLGPGPSRQTTTHARSTKGPLPDPARTSAVPPPLDSAAGRPPPAEQPEPTTPSHGRDEAPQTRLSARPPAEPARGTRAMPGAAALGEDPKAEAAPPAQKQRQVASATQTRAAAPKPHAAPPKPRAAPHAAPPHAVAQAVPPPPQAHSRPHPTATTPAASRSTRPQRGSTSATPAPFARPAPTTKPATAKRPAVPRRSAPKAKSGPLAPLDAARASQQVRVAESSANQCRSAGPTRGSGTVRLRLRPWGRVDRVVHQNQMFVGTPVGVCLMAHFQRLRVPPFSGADVYLDGSFSLE